MGEALYGLSVWVVPVILAITLHEAAHGYIASKLGDDTALRAGRVTFNPLKHIDPFGTIILPGLLLLSPAPFIFGYAKPVPVNFRALRQPRRDMVWVALAGPGINIGLALISLLLLRVFFELPDDMSSWGVMLLTASVFINILLAVFNMLPLPPLDGGRVAVGLLPRPLALPLARTERYGLFILIGLLFILPLIGNEIGVDLHVFSWIILPIFVVVLEAMSVLLGLDVVYLWGAIELLFQIRIFGS